MVRRPTDRKKKRERKKVRKKEREKERKKAKKRREKRKTGPNVSFKVKDASAHLSLQTFMDIVFDW